MPFAKGNTPWIKGKKVSQETRDKISKSLSGYKPWRHVVAGWNRGLIGVQVSSRKGKKYPEVLGEKNAMWKGDSAGIPALHSWIRRTLGTPGTCSMCGKSGLRGHQIHWASKDGSYSRTLSNWVRLCVKCHKNYDMSRLGKTLKLVDARCVTCDGIFKVTPYELKVRARKYCSPKCFYERNKIR